MTYTIAKSLTILIIFSPLKVFLQIQLWPLAAIKLVYSAIIFFCSLYIPRTQRSPKAISVYFSTLISHSLPWVLFWSGLCWLLGKSLCSWVSKNFFFPTSYLPTSRLPPYGPCSTQFPALPRNVYVYSGYPFGVGQVEVGYVIKLLFLSLMGVITNFYLKFVCVFLIYF